MFVIFMSKTPGCLTMLRFYRTGSIESRANSLNNLLREKAKGLDVNFLAHSMGGLDCRHLITHVKPTEYRPASLLTVCTPHRGSPFMDWCTVRNLELKK